MSVFLVRSVKCQKVYLQTYSAFCTEVVNEHLKACFLTTVITLAQIKSYRNSLKNK